MGVCLSSEDRQLKKKNETIDKELNDDAKRLKKECKILLLGGGESGKSTIVKQMKIIHQNGFTKEEYLSYRPGIFKNVIEAAQSICNANKKFGLEWESPQCKDYAANISAISLEADAATKITPELGKQVTAIWRDRASQEVMERTSEFYIMDCAPYLFENIDRICAPDYLPTETDILRARIKTTGIAETRFSMGQLNIHMFDVGGQRSERKKWIHCFEAVTSIIFCVALSEYDQVLLEESTQNRITESLILFEAVINSRWFVRTSIILFLNKIDLFKIKLKKVPLQNYFPEYAGGDDLNKAAKFMLWRFQQANRSRLNIYPHLTCATDTSQIRLVFAAVKETILQNALKDSGIL